MSEILPVQVNLGNNLKLDAYMNVYVLYRYVYILSLYIIRCFKGILDILTISTLVTVL